MKIENIIFDFGGVLVDWNPRYLYKDHFEDDNEMEHFLKNVCTDEWNAEQDRGRQNKTLFRVPRTKDSVGGKQKVNELTEEKMATQFLANRGQQAMVIMKALF